MLIFQVTCDGSFDCANEPEDQEKNVFALHFCELVASLSILRKGGVMVLKMFTMFENPAIGLMYLLSGLFEEVSVMEIHSLSAYVGNLVLC